MDSVRNLHLGKVVSLPETRGLMRKAALNRKATLYSTRDLMSKNNAKSVSITAILHLNGVELKKFPSTASAALYFFNDSNKRSKIRTALDKNKLLLGKYEVKTD